MPPAKETDGIEITGFILPSTVRLTATAESGLMVGAHFSTGMTISGRIKKMAVLDTGAVRVTVDQGDDKPRKYLLIFPTGMVAEVA